MKNKTDERKEYFEIREKWVINLFEQDKEYYFSIRQTEQEVKKYIEDWFEGWYDSIDEDEEKEIISESTDYKTFAKIKIRTGFGIDTMNLKVIKKKGTQENTSALQIGSYDEVYP